MTINTKERSFPFGTTGIRRGRKEHDSAIDRLAQDDSEIVISLQMTLASKPNLAMAGKIRKGY